MQVFDNILDLRDSTTFSTSFIKSLGGKSGVGAGIFDWIEDMDRLAIPEVPGFIIHPQAANKPATGGWKRRYKSYVMPEMAGAHGDDTDEVPSVAYQNYFGPYYQPGDNWDTVGHAVLFAYAEEELGASTRRVIAHGVYNYRRGLNLPREEKDNGVPTSSGGTALSYSYTGGHHKKAPGVPGGWWIHDTGDNPAYTSAFNTTYIENQYVMSEMTYEGAGCHGLRITVSSKSIVEKCDFIDLDHSLLIGFGLNSKCRNINIYRPTGRGIVVTGNDDPLTDFTSRGFMPTQGANATSGNSSSVSNVNIIDAAPSCKDGVIIHMLNLCAIDNIYIKGSSPMKRGIEFNVEGNGGPIWGISIDRVVIDMPGGFEDAAIVSKMRGTLVVSHLVCKHPCTVLYCAVTAGGPSPEVVVDHWGAIHPDCQFVYTTFRGNGNNRDMDWFFRANHESLTPETNGGTVNQNNFWKTSGTPIHNNHKFRIPRDVTNI